MKKILIISDTHMPKKGKMFPDPLLKVLKKDIDYIFHAGDWTAQSVYEELKTYAPLFGVKGNIDKEDWSHTLPEKVLVTIEDVKIAMIHGHQGKGRSTPERAYRGCEGDSADLIIFGHSHIPFHERKGSTILFNPGSPTDKRRQKQFSYGIAVIDQSKITLDHHYFS
ncbi:metallophosphoesterase family protein [Fictibacillus nanhaiensis]|uniref:metallophosphoesterase family protein n=1 Tax=Fictibacillus nanhaiensis TaxID=742169 RepID=UPI003C13B9B3